MLISIIIKNKIYGPAGFWPLRHSRELFQVSSHGIVSSNSFTTNWKKRIAFPESSFNSLQTEWNDFIWQVSRGVINRYQFLARLQCHAEGEGIHYNAAGGLAQHEGQQSENVNRATDRSWRSARVLVSFFRSVCPWWTHLFYQPCWASSMKHINCQPTDQAGFVETVYNKFYNCALVLKC